MSLYLTVYPANAPNGTSLGTIDAATELQYLHVADGLGSGKVKINRHHTQAALLTQGRYCRVHSDAGVIGAFWLENGPVDLSSFDEQGGEFIEWSGRGSIAILERGRLLEDKYAPAPPASTLRGSFDLPGIWRWSSNGGLDPEYYGGILRRALEEGQNQPGTPLAGVTPEFGRALDSSGAAWDEVADEYTTPIGTNTLDLVRQFTGMGIVAQVTHDLKFYAWNRANFGTVRSGAFGPSTVRFEKGVNIADAIQRNIHDWMRVSHLLVEGGDYTYVTVTDPSYPASAGKRWGFLSHEETVDTATLTKMGNENIAARKRRSDVFSFPLMDHGSDPANGLYEPGPAGHFWVGDTVTLHTGSETYGVNATAYQVSSITWKLLENGDYDIIVEIGQGYHWTEGVGGSSPGLCCGPEMPAAASPPTYIDGKAFHWDANSYVTGPAVDIAADDTIYAFVQQELNADTVGVAYWPDGYPAGLSYPLTRVDDMSDGALHVFRLTGALAGIGGTAAIRFTESANNGNAGGYWIVRGRTAETVVVNRAAVGAQSTVDTSAASASSLILSSASWRLNNAVSISDPTADGDQTLIQAFNANLAFGQPDQAGAVGRGGSNPVYGFGVSRTYYAVAIIVAGIGGDTTQPIGDDGDADPGTGGTYVGPDHVHEHGTHPSGNQHPEYATDADLTTHAAAADPHTGYVREADGNWVDLTDGGATTLHSHAGGGVTDHGALTGLADDDHPQYQKESEKGVANGYASLGAGGLVPMAQLASGTPDGTKFVRDDGTLVVPSGGGATDHGALTGLAADDHPQYVRTTDGGKEVVNAVAASGAAQTLDLALGNFHDVTLTANCTLTLAGATNGVGCSMALLLRQDATGSRTVTWPASVVWPDGVAPTLATAPSAVDIISLFTLNGGTTWFGSYAATGTAGADVLVKVSSNDTTAGYLNGKLVAGSGVTLTENLDGGNETLTIASTGGGGGGWTLAVDESGASFAGFTAHAGTWASSGTIINQTNTAASAFRARYDTRVPTSHMVAQVEVRYPAGGVGLRSAGILLGWPGTNVANYPFIHLLRDTTNKFEVGQESLTNIVSETVTLVDDTWYTITARVAGYRIDGYLDGVFKGSTNLGGGSSTITVSYLSHFVGLRAFDGPVDFRNFKVWVLTLPT